MDKLRKSFHLKSVEVLLIIIFFLFSLKVINWFEYPYIIVGGDLRPPLVREAFTNRVLSTWDEIDFGIPSVYSPRILDPFYFFITVCQTFGISLYTAQIVAVFLIYFLASVLAYMFIKQLTYGDTIAAFIATFFLTSNLHLISDREQTAIGFLDVALMILPCLVAFTKGISTNSYKLIALSGLLFVLTYGTFPNYRTSVICLIMIVLVCLYFLLARGINVGYLNKRTSKSLNMSINTKLVLTYLKHLFLFIILVLLTSIWIISVISVNSNALLTAYNETAAPTYNKYLKLYDVFRLIAKWSFYEGAFGKRYVPYANVYLSNPLIIVLSYLPPILAFTSLLVVKSRKSTIFFSVVAAISMILTSAFNPYSNELYSALAANIPLMIAFRESTNWIFFMIVSYAILIGATISTICHKLRSRRLQILVLCLTVAFLACTSYPLITGDVSRNWLNPQIKGSYLPPSYGELNDALSNNYWAMLLPERDTYVVYDFAEGPFSSGNPYPLIFSKPIISGIGTEYLQSENPDLPLDQLYQLIETRARGTPKFLGMLGVKELILEKNIISGIKYPVNVLELEQDYTQIMNWTEIALFENQYALPKLYLADSFLNYTSWSDMYASVENMEWSALNHLVFINSASVGKIAGAALTAPESFVWKELSPTGYEAHANSKGAFILVLLETYDSRWKLSVNGNTLPEANHLKANAFANGWLIKETGNLTITIEYETRKVLSVSVVASVLLPTLLIIVLIRADLKALLERVHHKRKSKSAQD